MIGTEFYKGQGLGNQFWVYAVIRSLAETHGYEFGFLGTEKFKGKWFELDFGKHNPESSTRFPEPRIPAGFNRYYLEEKIVHSSGADISPLDPAVAEVKDGTFLDGSFQSEKYFRDPDRVRGWFRPSGAVRDLCVINIRGGEFKGVPELFLGRRYYELAVAEIQHRFGDVAFEIVTDDAKLARSWFPNFPVHSSGGVKRFHGGYYLHPKSDRIRMDFERLQTARYLIIGNSSFSWWGAYTNPFAEFTLAPKFWARYNTSDGYWSNGDSLTSGWHYLSRDEGVFSYEECLGEL